MGQRYLQKLFLTGLLLAGLFSFQVQAARLEIDQGIRAAGLWCFPILDKPNEWVYLPEKARLATNENGEPEFSFLRYVSNESSTAEGTENTITEAAGGGILHFLVLYDTPEDQVEEAEKIIREKTDNNEIKIRGPVVFDSGHFALVSSIIGETGRAERKVLTTGKAPVLEGNRLALSFDLTPKQASLLLESFKMSTPDVSLTFDIGFRGIVDAYDAQMVVDWSEVRKSQTASAGGSIYFVSADVEAQIDDLLRNNSIKLESRGGDETTEALVAKVYDRILTLLFKQVEPERVPEKQRGGLMDAIGTLIDPKDGILSSRKTTGFGLYAGYQYKDIRSEGTTVLDFNHRAEAKRHHFISFNVGDLYRRYGDNKRFFNDVNISDPVFQQREIHVSVDGDLLPEFDKIINSVTLTLRKQHESGDTTLRELVLDKNTAGQISEGTKLIYGWSGDNDREAWLEYDYRTRWSFKGGGEYQTDWMRTDVAMIDLYAPFERRIVETLDAGMTLDDMDARAIIVMVEYPFFGKQRKERMLVRSNSVSMEQQIEITLPRDQFDYLYKMNWVLKDAKRITVEQRDDSGLIFLDPPPEES